MTQDIASTVAYVVRIEGNPVSNGRVEVPVESWSEGSAVANQINKALMQIPACQHRLVAYVTASGERKP